MPYGDRPGRVAVRSGRGHEDRLAVVTQLLDRLLDVGQGAVVTALGGGLVVGAGVPAAGELLDRRDVDDPVVQERLQGRHVPGQEGPVGGHGVAGQRRAGALGAMLADVVEDLLLGLTERDPLVQLGKEPGVGVHRADEVTHLLQRGGRRLDHQVDALALDVEIEVGHQRGHLDQGVGVQVEAGHFAVDPDESFVHACTLLGESQHRFRVMSYGLGREMVRTGRAARRRRRVDRRRSTEAARSGRQRARRPRLRPAPREHGPDGRPPAARARGRARAVSCAWRADPAGRSRLRAVVRGLHHRHRVGVVARHPDRVRLLRRGRVRRERDFGVPLGDRARRRPAAAVGVPGLAPAYGALGRRLDLPRLSNPDDPDDPVNPWVHHRKARSMSRKAARESAAARAAAVLAEQQRAESRRRLFIVGGVVLSVLLIVGVGFAIQSNRDTTGGNAATPTGSASATASASDTGGDTGEYAVAAADTYGLGLGDPSAKVKVEIFEDFLCPYCNEYEHAGRDQLRQDVADGKAYVVYRPIAFLNEYSVRALNAFAVVLEKS